MLCDVVWHFKSTFTFLTLFYFNSLSVFFFTSFVFDYFSISLLTPDEDSVSKALVFLIVPCVSSHRWVHFSRAVLWLLLLIFLLFLFSVDGLAAPTGNCSAGWYCTGSAFMSQPFTPLNATTLPSCSCPLTNYTGKFTPCSPAPALSPTTQVSLHLAQLFLPSWPTTNVSLRLAQLFLPPWPTTQVSLHLAQLFLPSWATTRVSLHLAQLFLPSYILPSCFCPLDQLHM